MPEAPATAILPNAELYDYGLNSAIPGDPNCRDHFPDQPGQQPGRSGTSSAESREVQPPSQDSSADYPLLQLRQHRGRQTAFLLSTNWSTNFIRLFAGLGFPPATAGHCIRQRHLEHSSIVNLSVRSRSSVLTGPKKLTTVPSHSVSHNVGALFGVLETHQSALPLANWTILMGSGSFARQFQFVDSAGDEQSAAILPHPFRHNSSRRRNW